MKDLIINFGCDQINIENIYPTLNKLLDFSNAGVRSEAINIYKEIYLFKRKEIFNHIKFSKDLLKVYIFVIKERIRKCIKKDR